MDHLLAVRTEFARYLRMVELAVDQIADADLTATLDAALDAGSNSIAVLLGHLSGNLRSRFTDFLASDGEKQWRNRDGEFADHGRSRTELLADWEQAWRAVDEALTAIEAEGPTVWSREVTIREQPLTVSEALLRSVAHVAGHTGQIVMLARHWAGSKWQTLSIPRGGSADYAKNPTRERNPDHRR